MLKMCCKCKKRLAVVFMQRLDANGNGTGEGYCLQCAKELGIKPISDLIDKMGIGEEEMDYIGDEMAGLLENGLGGENPDEDEDDPDGMSRAPSININSFFGAKDEGHDGDKSDTETKEKKAKEKKRKNLDAFSINLTKKALDGELDAVIGRDRELSRVLQILCRRQKNNPCLIGEPGVGKTAVAEALAARIAAGDVPYKLRNKEVRLLDMTSMVAGTQFRGQFENRMKGLLDEVKKSGNIILVIDEVHSIVAAGDAEGGMNAANILKPALSRGEVQVIGATTLAEYRKYIEKDAALERRFQPIVINEPTVADTVKILKGIKGYYEKFHGIVIPDDTVEKTVVYSERYITDRFLPDKAIDLLDEAASYLSLRDKNISDKAAAEDSLNFVRSALSVLEGENEGAADESEDAKIARYSKIADLKTQELKLIKDVERLSSVCEGVTLLPEHLATVIEIWTGIPASSINENEFVRIDRLEERLKTRIIGQESAISAVARAVKRSRAGISAKKKPVSFIFAGPTGVGKTELVKTIASDLFDSPDALIRLDMSEFMEKHSVSKLIGSPPGYVGYDEAGQLTEKIRRRPYCVVLFDEIEKAHPDVLNILLQVLDDGRITDAHGKEVNFENTMIVMTTNAGSVGTMNSAGFSSSDTSADEGRTQKALEQFLRPEFINRVDEIITFNSLSKENFASIARIMLTDLKNTLAEKGIAFEYTGRVVDMLVERSYSLKFGARNLRRRIQTDVEDKAAQVVISNFSKKTEKLKADVQDGEITVFEP